MESSKQISSLACCPMTVDSKTRTQHFVAPAISTAYPIIKEDAHRRLNQQESRALDLACEEGRTTARTMYLVYTWNLVTLILDEWSTLFQEHMHIDSSLLHPKSFSCCACEESQRRRLHAVAARVLHEPGACLQVDQFEWRHLLLNLHVLRTTMVDAGSRAASLTIHRVMDTEHGLGHVSGETTSNTSLNHWIKYYGKPNIISTDPEGARGDQEFRRGLAARSISRDIDLADPSSTTEVLGKNTEYHQTGSNTCGSKNARHFDNSRNLR